MKLSRKLMTTMGGGGSPIGKILGLFGTSIVAYWPFNDAAGTTTPKDCGPNSIQATATAVTFDGSKATFDGSTSKMAAGTAGFISAFDPTEGAVIAVVSAIWTSSGHIFYAYAGGGNNIAIYQYADAYFFYDYMAGATLEELQKVTTSTASVVMASSWSKSGDLFTAFWGTAAEVTHAHTLGTWSGTIDRFNVGCQNSGATPQNPFKGTFKHFVVLNRPTTLAELVKYSAFAL